MFDHSFDASYKDFVLEEDDILSVQINHILLSSKSAKAVETETDVLRAPTHTHLHGFTINKEGFVDLPTIGKVKVSGLTIQQTTEEIRKIAEKYYAEPTVKVFLINFSISVLGEVNQPGTYSVLDNRINIFQAIGMANDASDYANRGQVRILRSRGGKNHIMPIDLTDENLLSSEFFYLHPDDVVLVKPLKRKKYSGNDSAAVYRGISIMMSILALSITLARTFD